MQAVKCHEAQVNMRTLAASNKHPSCADGIALVAESHRANSCYRLGSMKSSFGRNTCRRQHLSEARSASRRQGDMSWHAVLCCPVRQCGVHIRIHVAQMQDRRRCLLTNITDVSFHCSFERANNLTGSCLSAECSTLQQLSSGHFTSCCRA